MKKLPILIPWHPCTRDPFEDDSCDDHDPGDCSGGTEEEFQTAVFTQDVNELARLVVEDPDVFINPRRNMIQAYNCVGEIMGQTPVTEEFVRACSKNRTGKEGPGLLRLDLETPVPLRTDRLREP